MKKVFRLKGFENLRAIGDGTDEVVCSKSTLDQSGRRAFYALVVAGVMAAPMILLPGCAGGGAPQPQQNNPPPNPGSGPARIAFSSQRALDGSDAGNTNNIFNSWVINADGTGATALTKLTAAGTNSFAPVWSPDGSRIAFQSEAALDGSDAASPNLTPNIWTVRSDGSGATPLTRITARNAGIFLSAWSPNGSKIVFDSSRALDGSDSTNVNQTGNVWIVNADGSGAKPLTALTASHADCFHGAWSPDGSKIAFASARALDGSDALSANFTTNLWLINGDGTGTASLTRLSGTSVRNDHPIWSPDGTRLIFLSSRALDGSDALNTNSTQNIWLMNTDGSGATPLTRLTAPSTDPLAFAWSPDGRKIAFISARALDGSDSQSVNKVFNLWLMNSDGSGLIPLTRLTALRAHTFDLAWFRDGSKLAISSARALDGSDASNANFTINIWVINSDGTGAMPLTRLTALQADSERPTWQP